MAILDKRNQNPSHHRKHFYLLQGLIYLEQAPNTMVKLTCSTPNANRDRSGVPYYCIPSSDINFLCHQIDEQVGHWMRSIQFDKNWIPKIRDTYVAQLEHRIGQSHSDDRQFLKKRSRICPRKNYAAPVCTQKASFQMKPGKRSGANGKINGAALKARSKHLIETVRCILQL